MDGRCPVTGSASSPDEHADPAAGHADPGRDYAEAGTPAETEPDARFTFANERTFLAWSRTALALVVAGLAIVQLLPPFPAVPWGRHVLGVPLIVLGALIAVAGYGDWTRNQRSLRRGTPLPRSVLPGILAGTITGIAVIAAVVLLVSALR
jgi:putative membrane protein